MRIAEVTKTISGDTALPQLDYDTLTAAGVVVPEFEDDAYADFLFDLTTDRCLQSRVSGPVLTLAGTAPTYSATGLTTASGGLNGLISPLADDAGSRTVVAITKRPTTPTAVAVIAGTASDTEDKGSFLYWSNVGSIGATIRKSGSDQFLNVFTVSEFDVGDWVFVALTESKNEDDTYDCRLWVGDAATPFTSAATSVAKQESTRTVGIGNAYNETTNYDERAVEFHRALLYNRALTVDELAALYARAKILAARRSVTVE